MPSHFPGMDPFIESQKWEDFHTRFITAMGDALVPSVRPKYVVEVERRVYLEAHDPLTPAKNFVADAAVFGSRPESGAKRSGVGGVAVTEEVTVDSKQSTVPYPEEHREVYLSIRRGSHQEVVTVIELLSPANKRRGTDGHQVFLDKRLTLMQTCSSLVELDLLRGGTRMPFSDPPEGDYYAMVSRPATRPIVDVFSWPLGHPLPVIPIPLLPEDTDARLNLQAVFNLVYERAGYDYSVDYKLPVFPELKPTEAEWVAKLLA